MTIDPYSRPQRPRIIEKANAHGKTSIDTPGSGREGDRVEMNTRDHEAFLCGSDMPHNPNWGVGEVPQGEAPDPNSPVPAPPPVERV